MNNYFLPAKSDIVFKMLFADVRNTEILTGFLKAVLRLPEDEYDEVTIVDPHLARDYPNDKLGILDLRVRTVTGKTIHVEIQIAELPQMRERIVFYDAKMITEQIGKGDEYESIKQVISIIITDYELIQNSSGYHHRFTFYDEQNNIELTDIIEIHTLELGKIPDTNDNRPLYDWMRFLNAKGESELAEIIERNPIIKKATARLMELSADEQARMLYELREKERMDNQARERGAREAGRAEGQTESKKTIARNLLKMNQPIDLIISVTGLTYNELEELM